MNRNKHYTGMPIRMKLSLAFTCTSLLVLIVNVYLYYNLNRTIGQIDTVYRSNIMLNELQDELTDVQDYLYQYLNTKSSDALNNYYTASQNYETLASSLNYKTVNNEAAMMEKHINLMSRSYMDTTRAAVQAKRGRDINTYSELYEEAEQTYNYISDMIYNLNNKQFQINASNYDVLRTSLNYLMILTICLITAIILFNVFLIIFMTRSITRPLIYLAESANEVSGGNFDVDIPVVETGDELTVLSKAFDKMICSIREYIAQTRANMEKESQMRQNELIMKNDLKDAQLKYLQAQINPHFLFNSLNAAAQLAMMEGAESTCMFIENMADFFRYNVRKIDTVTTLEEEISLVDNYMYITNVRFSGEIIFEKQIDRRLVSVQVPSMILQPVVENAVQHGVRGIERQARILLSVYQGEGRICISVRDNGIGMEPDTMNQIRQGQVLHGEEDKNSTGIGMDNVIKRLRNYYDTEEVIDIQSEGADKGTEVILYIPMSSIGGAYV